MIKLLLIIALLVAAIYNVRQTPQSTDNQFVETSMPPSDPAFTTNATFMEATISTAEEMARWVAYDPNREERIALWADAHHNQLMKHQPHHRDDPEYTAWYHNYQEVRAFIGLPYEGTTFYLWRAVFRAEHHRMMFKDIAVATPAYVAS